MAAFSSCRAIRIRYTPFPMPKRAIRKAGGAPLTAALICAEKLDDIILAGIPELLLSTTQILPSVISSFSGVGFNVIVKFLKVLRGSYPSNKPAELESPSASTTISLTLYVANPLPSNSLFGVSCVNSP